MSTVPLLICDDSNMARKQILRALPEDWPVSVMQACNGQEALELLRQARFDLLLLDLTMPILDGFGVLAAIQAEGIDVKVIVVSGDVQEEAVRRVTELGALAFLKKVEVVAHQFAAKSKGMHRGYAFLPLFYKGIVN